MAASDADAGGEPGLLLLVGRALGVGALVIAASAGLFLGIGAFGDDAGGEEGGAADGDRVAASDDDGDAGSGGEDEPGGTDDDATAGEDPGSDGSEDGQEDATSEAEGDDPDAATEGTEDGAQGEEGAEPDPDADESEEAEGAEGEDGAEDETSVIPPEDVSVQVLDGYGGDGGAAADAVAAALSEAGYRIIAQNPALAYDVTTVLWTAGHEEAARQVAAEIGAAEIREQPGNLSESVMVHVVVGADRG
ncbi:MAG: LytR C-terminal domain-containing protein [Nitriliruptoraceae bacterium]